jgi:hypothetical protein
MGYERLRFAVGTLLVVSAVLPGVTLLTPPAPTSGSLLPVLAIVTLLLSGWLVRRAGSYRQVVAFFLASWLLLAIVSYLAGDGVPLSSAGGSAVGFVIRQAAFVLPAYALAYWFGFHGGAERLYARLDA